MGFWELHLTVSNLQGGPDGRTKPELFEEGTVWSAEIGSAGTVPGMTKNNFQTRQSGAKPMCCRSG